MSAMFTLAHHIDHTIPPLEQLSFNEQVILDKLHNLKITKSPGPDGIMDFSRGNIKFVRDQTVLSDLT